MTKEIHGCACCSGDFGRIFAGNASVQRMQNTAGPGAHRPLSFGAVNRRDLMKGGAAVVGALGLMTTPAAAQVVETLVFTGGTILTVDAAFSEAEAIAIRGNSILAVGSLADVTVAAGADARVIDLAGKVVLPGFIDAHTHVVSGSVVDAIMEYVGMARFSTTTEVLDHIAGRVNETEPGEWLAFRNFDPAVQAGPPALTFADLDPIAPGNPVFVFNASGHLAYANTAAFKAAGIPDDVENPPGAEFVRDEAGKLTGTMKNNVAFLQVLGAMPALTSVEPETALVGLMRKWSRQGLTTVSELSLGGLSRTPADADVMFAAARNGGLVARIRAYAFYTIGADVWDNSGIRQGDGDALARVVGYKLVADGSNQGFTGLQREPYLNTEDKGLAYMSAEELRDATVDRGMKGWHIAIHGNGDAAIDNCLAAYEALRAAGADMSKVRGRIEHCSMLHDEQIEKMKDLGISASFLIGHVHYWGVAMRDTVFGPERVKLLGRARSLQDAGVGYSLHSDFMVTDPVPLHMMEMAVTRITAAEPDFVLNPGERITVEDAIRAMTIEPARQLYSDHEVGSLEVGKLADMVILDSDPRKVDPTKIKEIKVLETWMDGKQVYSAA